MSSSTEHPTNELLGVATGPPSNTQAIEQENRDQNAAGSGPATSLQAAVENDDDDDEEDGDDEGEDEGEEDDGDDEELDIREELEHILTNSSEFSGTFAFSHTYSDAPNPVVSLEGLGSIGLPLSEPEAKRLISHCDQAPFGKGERTIVDKEVRDTWEMDASKVKFLNTGWEKWIQETIVKEVCAALGVNVEASKPRAELYKLLVYETGSHFLPHVDTEKTDGMFATLIIVLPSKFTGSDAHLSHAGNKLVFNTSNESMTKTSVLAWYTDVMHEIKPITGGYRLALAYNFLHTSPHFRPALSAKADAVCQLRRVMKNWQNGGYELTKVIYELDHKYSRANLSASALKGADSDVFALVDGMAKELGFCIGLAHLQLTLMGYPEGDLYRSYRRGWGSDEEDEEDGDDLDFADIEERTVKVENLVDAEGKEIAKWIDFEEDTEAIPSGFIEDIEEGDHDGQEYEGYQGNYGGTLERFYRRTALVLWPPSTHLGNGGGNRKVGRALDVLRQAGTGDSGVSAAEGLELFDYARFLAPNLPKGLTLSVLCAAASSWNDPVRWAQAVTAFKGTKISQSLEIDDVAKAVEAWGWAQVLPSIIMMIEEDKSNGSRLRFLGRLRKWTEALENEKLKIDILTSVTDMTRGVMMDLRPPSIKEMETLTLSALWMGDVSWVQKGLLPQLLTKADVKFLEAYAGHLHQNLAKYAAKNENRPLLKTVVTDILDALLQKLDFFALASDKTHNYYPKTPETAKSFLKLCLDCDNADVATKAIGKLANLQGLGDDVIRTRTVTVLLPVLTFLNSEVSKRIPKPILPFGVLGKVGIEQSLKGMASGKYGPQDVKRLINAAVEAQDAGLVTSTIIPGLKSFPFNSASWRCLIEDLRSRDGMALGNIIRDLALTYARKLPISQAPPPQKSQPYYWSLDPNPHGGRSDVAQFRETINFVMKMGGIPALTVFVDRLLAPKRSEARFISSTLLPLIADLRSLAHTYKLPLSSDPFAKSIRTIINCWVVKVLGPRPDHSAAQPYIAKLKSWSCTCDPCTTAKKMLVESADRNVRLNRIGKPKRVHVEGMLDSYARGAATYQMIGGSPQGLLVTKADVIFRPSKWNAEQKKGVAIVKSIGNETVLKSIWGDYFDALSDSMKTGKKINFPAVSGSTIPTSAPNAVQSAVALAAAPQIQTQAIASAGVQVTSASTPAMSGSLFTQPPKTGSRPLGAAGAALPVTPEKRKATGPPEAIIDLCTP